MVDAWAGPAMTCAAPAASTVATPAVASRAVRFMSWVLRLRTVRYGIDRTISLGVCRDGCAGAGRGGAGCGCDGGGRPVVLAVADPGAGVCVVGGRGVSADLIAWLRAQLDDDE